MVAWIIYNQESAYYNRQYIQFYIEEGAKLGIDIRLILVEKLEFGVKDNHWFIKHQGRDTELPDFAICRAIYPLLSKHLELMGIHVFNNSFISEICNDKARTCQYLAKTGIRMVDTSFYQNNQLRDVLSKVEADTVIKAVDGHGGSQVFLAEPSDDRKYSHITFSNERTPQNTDKAIISDKYLPIIEGIRSSNLVVQPLTGSKHQDLRVYVIGKEIIAAVLRTAREGFKSNFSLGGEVRLYELTEKEKTLVKKIIDQFEFGLVGIDFIIGDEGEFIFNEIEDVVGSRMLYQCSDINIVELYLNYILDTIK
jgi:gamma-F420-2:alpha-L-glutamate ligase